MMSTDEHLLRQAIALLAGDASAGGPFGAIVARGDEILGRGRNRVVADGDPTAHAEVVAIREACRVTGRHSLEGCVLYASCEPCPMCLGAAWWARVDRVVMAATREDAARIGFDDAALHSEIARPLGSRTLPVTCLLRDEAVEAMASWAADPRRVMY